jgi:hypothetical protein
MEHAHHDGRFGERFDDEVSVSGVLWITVALAVACILGMLITWGMMSDAARSPGVKPAPIADDGRMPEGPLLQTDPEAELEAMRHEMADRLGGYGWANEGAGVVHIPIDKAMDLLVERGSVAAGGGGAAEPAAEETVE